MDVRSFLGRGAVAGAIGALTIAVGGIGVATAVNGGSLILGSSNSATHTTTLQDDHGVPLSLITKHSTAPLKVSSRALVKNLNAGELGGLSAGSLSTGSGAQLKVNIFTTSQQAVILPQPTGTFPAETVFPEAIVSTARLAAGSYSVTATMLGVNSLCWVGTTAAIGALQYTIADEGGTSAASAAVTETVTVNKGQRARFYCAGLDEAGGDLGGEVYSAGVTAVRLITASKGTVHSTSVAPAVKK
jgi:hypothetical protein